jgi:hypothetical protein
MGVVDEMSRMERDERRDASCDGGAGLANTNNPHGRTNKSTTSRAPAPSTCQHLCLSTVSSICARATARARDKGGGYYVFISP